MENNVMKEYSCYACNKNFYCNNIDSISYKCILCKSEYIFENEDFRMNSNNTYVNRELDVFLNNHMTNFFNPNDNRIQFSNIFDFLRNNFK